MKRERPLVLLNALKLHQGPNRLPTGNFQHVFHLADSLTERTEFNLRLLTDLDSHPPLCAKLSEELLIPTRLRGNSIWAADRAVIEAIRRYQPQIYHRPTGQLPFSRLPCKSITGIADLNFMALPHPFIKRLYKEISYRWSVSRADRVICVSKYTCEYVHRKLRVPPSKLRVVYHGTNALVEPNFEYSKTIDGRFFLAFAHQAHKNAELCLRIFCQLKDQFKDVRLVLVGANSFVDETLKPLSKLLNLGSVVRFVGAPSSAELSALYRNALGLLFPSRFEGFGLPILEAMGVGCPVISSNVCSLPEVAGDGALQLCPDDLAGWINAVQRCIVDEHYRNYWAVAGRSRSTQFTWKKAAAETVAIYQELLA